MACVGCGQQSQQQPCRTFSFPLGKGSVELNVRGEISGADVDTLTDYLDFARRVLVKMIGEQHG